jgi:hypothetical protein
VTKVWRPSSENIFDLFNDSFSNKLSLKLSIADYYSFEIFLSLNLSLIKVLSRLAFSLYFSYKLSMFKVICFINYSSLNSFLSRKFIPYCFFRFYNSARRSLLRAFKSQISNISFLFDYCNYFYSWVSLQFSTNNLKFLGSWKF